jgi:hypothetical protein
LPRETDHSDRPSTLPSPELNPLLNPLLGQNMGRWAEVYFTSPPEQREQAVLELLRELRAENSASADPILKSPSSLQEQPSEAAAEVQQTHVLCHECGRENPASHRFCGMCGKPVAEQGAADLNVSDLHISDLHVADPHIDEPPQNELAARVRNNESQFVRADDVVREPALSTNDLPPFQGGHDARTDEILNDPPASRSYRVYVGIAVVIVVFVVGYIAWHSVRATSRGAHVEPLAPPAVATLPAAPEPTPTPSASKTNAPNRTASANQSATQQAAIPSHTDPERVSADARSGDKTTQIAPLTTPGTLVGNGAEELAMAQRYLNGTDGQERNRAEGAKWLWKAVAKHNAGATLLLSDLYLKGDGVGKNCEQARVLLDAAARKGVKDAGDRLRHLQAFGCD